MKREKIEKIEKDLRNLQKVISSFQDGLDEIKHQFEKLQDKEDTAYYIGQRFLYTPSGEEYILAGVGGKEIMLINTNKGRRWAPGVEVRSPSLLISEKEFNEIAGNESECFELIKIEKQ